uniref:RRM domain-containing protein n=1 Tax=Strigamia maritima TaxID=126957 RepID=T1IYB7_STRMM
MDDQYHVGAVAATLKSKSNKVCSKFADFFESNVSNKPSTDIDPQKEDEPEPKIERKPRKRKVNKDNLDADQKKTKKIKTDDPLIDLRTPTPDPKTSKKVAVIHKNFNPKRHNVNAFVKFETPESAESARQLNGHKLDGFVLRVDLASNKNQPNHKKSIFVGNLPFEIEENSLYEHFSEYGEVESVRIIRDKMSGIGKGFGYINFKSEDSVHLALKITAKPLEGRTLRVSRAMTREKLDEKKRRNIQSINKTSAKERNSLKGKRCDTFQGETAKLKVKKKKKKPQISKNKKIYFKD